MYFLGCAIKVLQVKTVWVVSQLNKDCPEGHSIWDLCRLHADKNTRVYGQILCESVVVCWHLGMEFPQNSKGRTMREKLSLAILVPFFGSKNGRFCLKLTFMAIFLRCFFLIW